MKNLIRKIMAVSFCVFLVLTMSACSSGSPDSSQQASQASEPEEVNPEEEVEQEPLDLTGNWAQKGEEGSDTYMAGYIKDNVIELFWITDGGKSGNLYWSGTYVPPAEPGDTYTWDSVNDKIKTDYALLASGDDTKTFSYGNGEISYSVSMMEQTTTVSLVPSEHDYSVFTPAGGSSGAALDGQQIVLEYGAYNWITDGDYCTLFFAARIHNPNEEYAVDSPRIQITLRSEDNVILKTEEKTLTAIAANDTILYAATLLYEGKAPASVDMTVSNDDRSYMHQEGSGVLRQDELVISNVSENMGEYNTTYTGEVTNNSTLDQDSLDIIVIFKKGDDVISGISGGVSSVRSGETKPFEVDAYGPVPEHDSYEIYALQ